MVEIKLTTEKIPVDRLMAEAFEPTHGAQVVFVGAVRNRNHGRNVLGVSYDAFAPLAEQTFESICIEAKNMWGQDLSASLWHRVGRLGIGEISVAIVVSTRHRDESFKAARFIIEELKNRAPIWKQEHYEDGDSEWLQGHALCGHHDHESEQTSGSVL